jgi:hypothetical protein
MILPELNDATPAVQQAYAKMSSELYYLDATGGRSPTAPGYEELELHDVLVAFLVHARDLQCSDELTAQRRRSTRTLISHVFQVHLDSMAPVRTFVDVTIEYPENASELARAVGSSNPRWPIQAFESDEFGRLTRSLYDDARLGATFSRSEYLIRRLADCRLSDHQCELAKTLSQEWDGTLGELVDTARALQPDTQSVEAI